MTANGPNDTIHYVWGFIGRPTILLAVTDVKTSLNVNWHNLLFGQPENSIQFDSKPFYTFGIAFNRVSLYPVLSILKCNIMYILC